MTPPDRTTGSRRRWPLPAWATLTVVVLAFGALGSIATLALGSEPSVRTAELYPAGEGAAPASQGAGTPATPATAASTMATAATMARNDTAERILVGALDRIRIPRIGVDAPVLPMGVGADGFMEAPADPESVAWYDFTSKPGLGHGNAVFAGHRDWGGYGPAAFWDLGKLELADVIEVELEDGTVLRYQVMATDALPIAALDMREILAPTMKETVTLITCAGIFQAGDYTERLIVRAVRLPPSDGDE